MQLRAHSRLRRARTGKSEVDGSDPPFFPPGAGAGVLRKLHLRNTPWGGRSRLNYPYGKVEETPYEVEKCGSRSGWIGGSDLAHRIGSPSGLGDNSVSDRGSRADAARGDPRVGRFGPKRRRLCPLIPFGVLDPCAKRRRVHRPPAGAANRSATIEMISIPTWVPLILTAGASTRVED